MVSRICTIGFSQKSLRQFVSLLKSAGVTHIIDIRRQNTSQLAGYAKKNDLVYVLELVGIEYTHDLDLAPDQETLDDYRKGRITWEQYAKQYNDLLMMNEVQRRYQAMILKLDGILCFLCSEHKPDNCHRSLCVDYILKNSELPNSIEVIHLL